MQQRRPITPPPVSSRTELRTALAELDAARVRVAPVAALRAWRERAARSYVRRASSQQPKQR